MTFLESLQSHKGGLIRLKTELFWYTRGGWDGVPGWDRSPGRICLVLDVAAATARAAAAVDIAAHTAAAAAHTAAAAAAHVLLLIDGCPQWIWVGQADVELL